MRKFIYISATFLIFAFWGCKGKQVGCVCEDGWVSHSMGGPGTCSHHGGVDYELYESDIQND